MDFFVVGLQGAMVLALIALGVHFKASHYTQVRTMGI
jgi:hypothetical protein